MLKQASKSVRLPDTVILESGARLDSVEIGYDAFGALTHARSNAVLVLHALTGWSNPLEWWSGLCGEGKLIDPADHCIICPNYIGSCYGSSGPESLSASTGEIYGGSFPELTISDIARANWQLLDALGIDHVQLGIGGSMGGMVLLEMALQQPDRFAAIVPIAVSGSHNAWRLAFSSVIVKTIAAFDPSLRDRESLECGLQIARQIATISYRSGEEFNDRFDRQQSADGFEVENYLEHQGHSIVERFSPYSYLTLTKAMMSYDLHAEGALEKRIGKLNCKMHFVGISSDVLYGPEEIKTFSTLFRKAVYSTLHSTHGHDSFLVDAEALGELLRPFVYEQLATHPVEQEVFA